MRVVLLSLAGVFFGCDASQNELEAFISHWVQGQIGKTVGDGQCTAVLEGAEDAARSAGYSVPKMTRGCYSDTSIYCWSDTEISYGDLEAGDFVQFKDWYEKVTEPDGSWHSKSAKHHSAVVREKFDGTTLKVWEQNPGSIHTGEYHPYIGTGEIHAFKMKVAPSPLPSPSPSPSPTSCTDYSGWKNQDGDTCYTYSHYNYCTADGGMGSGWSTEKWGKMEDWYDSDGNTAMVACCFCGGGSSGEIIV